jgi:molecular chaperone GrpE
MADPQTEHPTPSGPDQGPDAAGEPTQALDLVEELAAAQRKADEFYDQFVRAQAEMQNIRRRAQDDIAKAHKFAIEGFAESLLPVRDSLEMALTVAAPSVDSLREGVSATLRQLASAFEKNRVLEINPVGEKFDPNRHQAISTVPAAGTQPTVAPNHVVTVLQKGYLINERVLRPAMVVVAQG